MELTATMVAGLHGNTQSQQFERGEGRADVLCRWTVCLRLASNEWKPKDDSNKRAWFRKKDLEGGKKRREEAFQCKLAMEDAGLKFGLGSSCYGEQTGNCVSDWPLDL